MIGFGNNTNISSSKYVPYLYNRIKSIVLSFTNNSELLATRESILIPTDADGSDPSFVNSENTFSVFYGGINQTSSWTISLFSETDLTVTQVDNTFTVTSISADEAEYVIRASRPDYSSLTKTIKVYTTRKAAGWTDGYYDDYYGTVTFESDDGLGFVTGDLRGGPQGDGWTGGYYTPATGIVTFTSDDGIGFATTDLRGYGWTGGSYEPTTGIVTFTSDNGLGFATLDLRGHGWTGGSYNSATGVVTFTSDDGLGFATDDLRATGGTIQNVNLSIQATDEGTVAGNTRGDNAVDLQTSRVFASQIASNTYSVVIGGQDNEASSLHSTVLGGYSNSSENSYAISGGTACQAQGIASISLGDNNLATFNYSAAFGQGTVTKALHQVTIGKYNYFFVTNYNNMFAIGNGTSVASADRSDAFSVGSNGVYASVLKSGVDQATAGAVANEIWIDTADNSLKIGV